MADCLDLEEEEYYEDYDQPEISNGAAEVAAEEQNAEHTSAPAPASDGAVENGGPDNGGSKR